ncbi:MAG: penicillin acylase family protein [Oceanococcaceae bacterium]
MADIRHSVLLILLLGATLAGCTGGRSPATDALPDSRQGTIQAQLRWTDYGIVHVKADDYRGLGYGYAYAVAEENLCRIADVYVTVSGERSKYFGWDL